MAKHARTLRILACLLALMVVTPLALAESDDENKPNIVLVLMDNFGYGEIGVYGGGVTRGAPTPATGIPIPRTSVTSDTPMTERQIQIGLYLFLTRRKGIPNLWPNTDKITGYEADLLAVTKAGYAYEYEIKRSLSDFRADKKKLEKHASLSGIGMTKIAINRGMEIRGMQQALEEALEIDVQVESVDTGDSRKFNEILEEHGTRAALSWRAGKFVSR